MNKRPLMTMLGLFLLGIPAGRIQEQNYIIPIFAAGAAVMVIKRSICHERRKQVYGILLLFLFILGFMWSYGAHSELEQKKNALPGKGTEVSISGTVIDIKSGSIIIKTSGGRLLVRIGDETRLLYDDSIKEEKEAQGFSGDSGKNGGEVQNFPADSGKDKSEMKFLPGDGVRVEGEMSELSAGTNPGSFDAISYYESEGIVGSIYANAVTYDPNENEWIRRLLSGVRRSASAAIYRILPEREAGVLAAMLLGEKTGLDKELKELYQDSGIAHILAISGLHVSLLGGAVSWILLAFGLGRRKASLITIFLLISYGFMTGFSPATLRAVIMLISVNLAGVFRRVSDLPTATTCSLFLLLLLEPWRVSSSGMLMSFLAVAAVGSQQQLYRDIFQRERFLSVPLILRKTVKVLIGSVLLSVTVQLFLTPIMMRDYYSISPYAILLNLIVVPLLTVAVGSGALGMLAGLIPAMSEVGTVAALPCRGILAFYEWICRLMQKVPGHEIVTGHISDEEMAGMLILTMLLIFTLHVLLCRKRKKKHRVWWYVGVLLSLGMNIFCFAGYGIVRNLGRNEIIFFDVGQGDGALMHYEGYNILFDFGSSSKTNPGEKVLFPGLKYYGITKVDIAILSHTDQDHTNGILELLEDGAENGIRTDMICLAAGTEHDEMLGKIEDAALKTGTGIVYLADGDEIVLGEGLSGTAGGGEKEAAGDEEKETAEDEEKGATGDGEKKAAGDEAEGSQTRLKVIYPPQHSKGQGNDYSLVIMLELPELNVLFTGDISSEIEEELADRMRGAEKPDILKVAHHGSKYSSSDDFLNSIAKQGSVAIISCGRKNTYGHPHKETLERLREAGCEIYRTDLQGAITIKVSNNENKVVPFCE